MNATATIAPGRDAGGAPQHLLALRRANEVRLARADLKRRIAAGETGVGDVVLDTPWEAKGMTVSDLLMSQRRWGHTRCRKFLSGIPMTEAKTVGTLTDRQRQAVAHQLRAAGAPAEPVCAPVQRRGTTQAALAAVA